MKSLISFPQKLINAQHQLVPDRTDQRTTYITERQRNRRLN